MSHLSIESPLPIAGIHKLYNDSAPSNGSVLASSSAQSSEALASPACHAQYRIVCRKRRRCTGKACQVG